MHSETEKPPVLAIVQSSALKELSELDSRFYDGLRSKFIVQTSLTRQLVSFQANKTKPAYRWYKYKEAFSAPLVENLLQTRNIHAGKILDPFAGAGTALFASATHGLDADGIELLPIGCEIILTRLCLENDFTNTDFNTLRHWCTEYPWEQCQRRHSLIKLKITQGAYPPQTEEMIERYISASQSENERVRRVLHFALLCILEAVSYTRKDGQYLRWDQRSGRRQGTRPFDKGEILGFKRAITSKLKQILIDTQGGGESPDLFKSCARHTGKIQLLKGSCLSLLPELPDNGYDAIITSPPYCNRYDYTRTYALELASLGAGENDILSLRQEMLSCTVENRAKDLLSINQNWAKPVEATNKQELLQAILQYLENQKIHGLLNNNGIPRMVRGYFYELACVIYECHRVLKPGAYLFMVNDNVRYAGASISVDIILSHIAGYLGFDVEKVLILPKSKGNSSQQMGQHGKDALRKCVYVWRKQ